MIMNLSQGVNLDFRSNNFHLLESIQPGHNSLDNSQPGHKATGKLQVEGKQNQILISTDKYRV